MVLRDALRSRAFGFKLLWWLDEVRPFDEPSGLGDADLPAC